MSVSVDFEHFIGVNTVAKGVAFHPNGQNYIYASGGNLLIGDLTNPNSQEFLRRHDDHISCFALSKSGNLVASGQRGSNADIHVWDFNSRQVIFTFEEHDHMVQSLEFSEDEKLLVSLGSPEDSRMFFWDLSNGCIITSTYKLPPETVCLTQGGFVRDIKRRDTSHYMVCTGSKEGMAIWDLDPYTGDLEMYKVTGDPRGAVSRSITAIALSDCKEFIYGATTSGDFVVVQVRYLRYIQIVQATKMMLCSLLTLDRSTIIGCGDATIKFFDNNCEYSGDIKLDGSVLGLSFGPDRLEALAITSNGTIYRVNLASRQHITISESHTKGITAVAYPRHNCDRFATASMDGTIRVWDIAEYAVTASMGSRREQDRGVYPLCLTFADIILSGWTDGRILAHKAETGDHLWFIDRAHPASCTALALSHNRRFLLSGGEQGEVRLWELKSREMISHLKEHIGRVNSIAIFHDDTMACSASRDRNILRWDLKTERRTYCHNQRMGGVNAIALSSDESHLVSVGQDKRLVYWNNGQLEPVRQDFIDGENDEGRCIVVSHNGKLIATGGTAGLLRIWNYQTGRLISASPGGHSSTISSIVFAPDDRQIISVAEDGTITIWLIFANDEPQGK